MLDRHFRQLFAEFPLWSPLRACGDVAGPDLLARYLRELQQDVHIGHNRVEVLE